MEMTGAQLKEILEDVADNIFHPDPYFQGGGDMVRVGGIGYAIDVSASDGQPDLRPDALRSGQPIEAAKSYVVAGWASVNEGTQGPPIWEVVRAHVARVKTVTYRAERRGEGERAHELRPQRSAKEASHDLSRNSGAEPAPLPRCNRARRSRTRRGSPAGESPPQARSSDHRSSGLGAHARRRRDRRALWHAVPASRSTSSGATSNG
jgi:hypothetical protein